MAADSLYGVVDWKTYIASIPLIVNITAGSENRIIKKVMISIFIFSIN
jgi:hypothetical protein